MIIRILPTSYSRRTLPLLLTALLTVASFRLVSGQDATRPRLTQESASAKVVESAKDKGAAAEQKTNASKTADDRWIPLLPEKGLAGWEITDFGEKGKVTHEGNQLIIEMGDPLNGINYTKNDFPTDKYEIYVEANRLEGSDFLCGLTFPVQDKYCSFIAGGWGGGLVGLSSVDGFDASENSTTSYLELENNRWYKFRIRVDPEYIRAWIDGDEYLRQEREGHEFSTRIEVYSSRPIGYCAFQSKVAIREFKWRPIFGIDPDAESESKADDADE